VTFVYHFAIVILLGLACYKAVEFLTGLVSVDDSRVRLVATLGVGVLFAEILDYSVFAGWGVALRDTWMGPVWTGLIIGGMAYVWHEFLGLIEGYGRRQRDEALELERRSPRAA
jgi:hypothetical protein